VSNSSGTHQSFHKFLSRENRSVRFAKPECPVLKFEFLSRFFVNLLLEVIQVIVIAYFYLWSVWKLIELVLCLTPWQNRTIRFSTVLILLQVLLNFRIVYSPPSRRHQGTFKITVQSENYSMFMVFRTCIYYLDAVKQSNTMIADLTNGQGVSMIIRTHICYFEAVN
jgi:hypothetical protein